MAEEIDDQQEIQPKKSFLKFIILAVMVVVIGAGGYVGWTHFKTGEKQDIKKAQTTKPTASKKKDETKIVFPVEPFIVNLADRSGLGKRYLKVTLALEVRDEEKKKIVEGYTAELRDTILLLLSSQSFSEISTMEGKLELKQALLSRINHALGGSVVQRLYFTEFVVQ
ncbi:MAG: flagellar basal body-associated FliL family protein [Deltaproteobacteria bacterium]|nr:flagellar basal body-associated FliL family protein [Deltaproteobacteria bacterium]MBW2338806.1 flagellar basal body-associated FliL family protein [Deltaproteobacteria bacterium]